MNFYKYTVSEAGLYLSTIFFSVLKNGYTLPDMKSKVVKAREKFCDQVITIRDIQLMFGVEYAKYCLQVAKECLVKLALRTEKKGFDNEDEDDFDVRSACSVCHEKPATQHVLHGSTVHKCLCAGCAIRWAVEKKSRCPLCAVAIDSIRFAPFRKSVCGCGGDSSECKLVLVLDPTSTYSTRSCDLENIGRFSEVLQVFA